MKTGTLDCAVVKVRTSLRHLRHFGVESIEDVTLQKKLKTKVP